MKNSTLSRLASFMLFALFICVLLLTLVAGVRSYSALIAEKNASDSIRYSNGLLINSVKSYDAYDSVRLDSGPEGRALVLCEALESGTYETRIYKYEGNIVEEYTIAGNPYSPGDATTIMPSKSFDFTYEKGLLTIVTDNGKTEVALRAAPAFGGIQVGGVQ